MNPHATAPQARFEPLSAAQLDQVTTLERLAHDHPWQRSHFEDCLSSGYQAQLLLADAHLLGYFVAMQGFEEVHLLNLTVAPAYQRQGWARVMLEALALWSRGQQAHWLWLEVRASNSRALQLYRAHGFAQVAVRRGYYPAAQGQREDALVMNLPLHAAATAGAAP